MSIASIVDKLTSLLDRSTTPANCLPPTLLRCVSNQRPGLSAYEIAANIIRDNQVLGIPTRANEDGSLNLINGYTYNVVKNVVDALQNKAVIQAAIPGQSIKFQGTGGNAGGPVEVIGYNLIDSLVKGIIR